MTGYAIEYYSMSDNREMAHIQAESEQDAIEILKTDPHYYPPAQIISIHQTAPAQKE